MVQKCFNDLFDSMPICSSTAVSFFENNSKQSSSFYEMEKNESNEIMDSKPLSLKCRHFNVKIFF